MSDTTRQLAAIMFADIVGYTAMMSKDEEKTLTLIDRIREIMKSLVEEYRGKWLKEMGDGFLTSFTSASDAVNCSIKIQERVSELDAKLRIGIHVGEIIYRSGDIFGDGVNIASRLQDLAAPGGVIISDRVYEDVFNKSGIEVIPLGEKKLKNVERPLKVFTLNTGDVVPEHVEAKKSRTIKKGVVITILVIVALAIAAITRMDSFFARDTATELVTVEDEEGNQVERIVPKTEFLKKLGIFFFRAPDENVDWLSGGVPIMISADLGQDVFVHVRTAYAYVDDFQRAKINDISEAPVSLLREIANSHRLEHFITGDVQLDDEIYTVNLDLYDTQRGSVVASQKVQGDNLLQIIDQLTLQLKYDLGLTEDHITSTQDLPIDQIMSSSVEAIKYYTTAANAFNLNNDYGQSIGNFSAAIQTDPNFVAANFQLAAVFFMFNQWTEARKNIEQVLDKIYVLPERERFVAKSLYYTIEGDLDKRYKVLNMWKELYPQDIEAYRQLGLVLFYSGQLDKAEEVYKEALELDDYRGTFYLMLAQIAGAKKDNAEAIRYYNLFKDKYPENPASFNQLGNFYLSAGSFDEAETNLEKASLLNSGDIGSRMQLAYIKERKGEFDEALNDYTLLLENSNTIQDSLQVLQKIHEYFYLRGEVNRAIDLRDRWLELAGKIMPPIQVAIMNVTRLQYHFMVGREEEALQIINETEAEMSDSFEDIPAYGMITYYLNQGDIENTEIQYQRLLELKRQYGSSANIEMYYEAELELLKENYDRAIEVFSLFRNRNIFLPMSFVDSRIADAYVQKGEIDKALETLTSLLKAYPFDPDVHYGIAKIYLKTGEKEKALQHLEIVDKIWENADEEFTEAQEAKSKLRELQIEI